MKQVVKIPKPTKQERTRMVNEKKARRKAERAVRRLRKKK